MLILRFVFGPITPITLRFLLSLQRERFIHRPFAGVLLRSQPQSTRLLYHIESKKNEKNGMARRIEADGYLYGHMRPLLRSVQRFARCVAVVCRRFAKHHSDPSEVQHLYPVPMWYLYMPIGLCLYMPVLSSWVATARCRQKQFMLGLWAVTLFLPYAYSFYAKWIFG